MKPILRELLTGQWSVLLRLLLVFQATIWIIDLGQTKFITSLMGGSYVSTEGFGGNPLVLLFVAVLLFPFTVVVEEVVYLKFVVPKFFVAREAV